MFDFYIEFENPIKNITSIKILDTSIVLNTKNGDRNLNYDDIYYIELNNYDRIISYKNTATTFNTYKYFEAISYNHSSFSYVFPLSLPDACVCNALLTNSN